MGDGVYAGCCGYGWWKGHGEVDVVDDGFGEDLGVGFCCFAAVFGFAHNGCHFAAGVSGWDADVRDAGPEGDGLAEAGGAAAADGDDAVGVDAFKVGEGFFGDVVGCVHGGFCESAGACDG